jgi:hypothetical protein
MSDWNLSSFVNTTYHSTYHPLHEIHSFIRDIASLHPSLVTVVKLGHSGQGKEMLGLTISRSESGAGQFKDKRKKRKKKRNGKKLGFVITGAQHAREVCHHNSIICIVLKPSSVVGSNFVRPLPGARSPF